MVPYMNLKYEPKKMPRRKPVGKKPEAQENAPAKPGGKKAPAKPSKQIEKPKKYPKGSAGKQWREQVATSQRRFAAAAAAVVAFAAGAQTDSEAATTRTPASTPADESDLEYDPFSDII